MKSAHDAPQIAFYITPPTACGYLPGERTITVFADPHVEMNTPTYSALVDLGFRRSGRLVYAPHCPACDQCISARIPVQRFRPSRAQRRTQHTNRDVQVTQVPTTFIAEHYALYRKYVSHRHTGGGMEDYSAEQYSAFIASGWGDTTLVEFRVSDQLLAVAVMDRLERGLSAVYTFFDPDHAPRSLGTLAVLWQIAEAERLHLPYVYLGYYIPNCDKMNYKTKFQPLELFIRGVWQLA